MYTEEDHWRVVFFRYGSLTDFTQVQQSVAEISKRLRYHKASVAAILKRFSQAGNKVVLRRRFNNAAPR